MENLSQSLSANVASLGQFGAELALIAGILATFIVDLTTRASGRRTALLSATALAAVVGAGILLAVQSARPAAALFNGLLVQDPLAVYFKWLFLAAAVLAIVMAASSREVARERLGEYLALLLSMSLGLLLMASASDFLMIYLAIELVSLVSYLLAGYRRKHLKSAESALKYVIYGGVASGVMLFGMSWLYGLFGTMDLAVLSTKLAAFQSAGPASQLALFAASLFVLSGIGYKIASVPWHMWCPDVYEGAPTPFTAFLSVAPKAAGFAVAIRFFMVGLSSGGTQSLESMVAAAAVPWQAILGFIAAVTMTLGNLAALNQTNLKRLLAYSSIAHAGYLLMGLACGTGLGVMSVLVYLAFYLLMNLGAFWVVQQVSARTGDETIFGFRGLSKRSPVLAIAMVVFLFSLTGIPGLAGFVGKFFVFYAAVMKAQLSSGLGATGWWFLILCAALNSAVALFYYARIVRAMFLEKSMDESRLPISWGAGGALAALAASVIFFGLYWPPVSEAAQAAVQTIFRG